MIKQHFLDADFTGNKIPSTMIKGDTISKTVSSKDPLISFTEVQDLYMRYVRIIHYICHIRKNVFYICTNPDHS